MASRGVNKVILIGNLGADPDIRYMPSGDTVANLSLATSENWKDSQSGELREKTEWHRVVAFRKLAEIIGQYCNKGSKLYIEGRLQTRKWQDQSGQDHYTTEIIATTMQMLDSKQGGAGNNPPPLGEDVPPPADQKDTDTSSSNYAAASAGSGARKRKTPPPSKGDYDPPAGFDDDDIPF